MVEFARKRNIRVGIVNRERDPSGALRNDILLATDNGLRITFDITYEADLIDNKAELCFYNLTPQTREHLTQLVSLGRDETIIQVSAGYNGHYDLIGENSPIIAETTQERDGTTFKTAIRMTSVARQRMMEVYSYEYRAPTHRNSILEAVFSNYGIQQNVDATVPSLDPAKYFPILPDFHFTGNLVSTITELFKPRLAAVPPPASGEGENGGFTNPNPDIFPEPMNANEEKYLAFIDHSLGDYRTGDTDETRQAILRRYRHERVSERVQQLIDSPESPVEGPSIASVSATGTGIPDVRFRVSQASSGLTVYFLDGYNRVEANSPILQYDETRGLIQSPTPTDKGLQVITTMQPLILPGSLIRVISKGRSVDLNPLTVRHVGDNYGSGDFRTIMDCAYYEQGV